MENVIIAVFEEESVPFEALAELKTREGQSSILEAAIVKKNEGAVVTKDGYNWANDEHFSSWISGGLLGGLIGIIGGPLGMLLGSSTGILLGSVADATEEIDDLSLIASVSKCLENGQTALIAVADELDSGELDDFFKGFGQVKILRRDVAAVQAEIYQAQEAEADLREKAVEKMYEEKKDEWHQKAAEEKNKIKQDFINLRNKIETNPTIINIANELSSL